jgi:excisionase family DNA binding protein
MNEKKNTTLPLTKSAADGEKNPSNSDPAKLSAGKEKGEGPMNFVTAKELSALLKVSDSTIYNLAISRKLPAFKLGGSWRFDLDEILRLIRDKEAGAVLNPRTSEKN